MLRSLKILSGLILVALLLAVGYAFLGLGGPGEELRRAQAALRAGDEDRALTLLDRVVADLDDRPGELLGVALWLRSGLDAERGNQRRALVALRRVWGELDERGLQVFERYVGLLHRMGTSTDSAALLDEAAKVIAQAPAGPRQTALQGINQDLQAQSERARLHRSLIDRAPQRTRTALRRRLDRVLYSLQLEPQQVETWIRDLRAGLGRTPGSLASDIQNLHASLAAARPLLAAALAGVAPDLQAFATLRQHLERGRELDTLLSIASDCLPRCPMPGRLQVAEAILAVHQQAGRPHAVLAQSRRTLDPAKLPELFAAGKLDEWLVPFLIRTVIAATELGDRQTTDAVGQGYWPIQGELYEAFEGRVVGLHQLIAALLLEGEARRDHLTWFLQDWAQQAVWWDREEMSARAFRMLVEMQEGDARLDTLQRWVAARPTDPDPVWQLARACMGQGKAERCIEPLRLAIRDLSHPDASLRLLAEAEQQVDGLDLDGVLTETHAQGRVEPTVLQLRPALGLPLAQRAIATRHFDIAARCLRTLRESFPGCTLPRLLAIELEAAQGRVRQARLQLETLLQTASDQPAVLQKGLELGLLQPSGAQLKALLQHGVVNAQLAGSLVDEWRVRGRFDLCRKLAARTTPQFRGSLELQLLLFRCMLEDPDQDEAGRVAQAQHCLELARRPGTPPAQAQAARLAEILFRCGDESAHGELRRLLDGDCPTGALRRLAAALLDRRHLEAAREVLVHVAEHPRHQAARSTRDLRAAAEISARTGDLAAAGRFWLAALGRGDNSVGGPLAILALGDGRPDAAREFPAPERPRRLADICRAALLDPAQGRAAIPVLRLALQESERPLDLQLLLACLGESEGIPKSRVRLCRGRTREMLLLLAELDHLALNHRAAERAAALRSGGLDDPCIAFLEGRARYLSGQDAAAAQAFRSAGPGLGSDPVLFDAFVELLGDSPHSPLWAPAIKPLLLQVAAAMRGQTPAPLLGLVFRQYPELLDQPGLSELTLPIAIELWTRRPGRSRAGLEQVRLLRERGAFREALLLLEALEGVAPEAARESALFRLASEHLDALGDYFFQRLNTRALAQLSERSRPAHPAALHFLAAAARRLLDGNPDDPRQTQTLKAIAAQVDEQIQAHLDSFPGSPRTPDEDWVASLWHEYRYVDRAGARRRLQAMLQQAPSRLGLWQLQADWAGDAIEIGQALDGLLWMPRFLKDPDGLERLVPLLARHQRLVAEQALLRADAGLLAESDLARGLVQLRHGLLTAAVRSLENAPASPTRDIFLSQAWLGIGTTEARARARRLLQGIGTKADTGKLAAAAALVSRVLAAPE